MSAKVKITDKNNIPKLLQVLDDLESHKIEIGIFGSDDSTILMIATENNIIADRSYKISLIEKHLAATKCI